MALRILTALDTAKTQFYHFKAIVIAGMGLFTDAYDLFCIPPIMGIIGSIYHENEKVPHVIISVMLVISLLGAAIGQVVFGILGDRMGRRRVYGLALMIMVFSSIGCGLSMGTCRLCVLSSLGFFRFFLGVGIGGDYPLSATIMSEFANRKTRGTFMAGVFSMQGLGILVSSTVTMIICSIFDAIDSESHHRQGPPPHADLAWRIILIIGAFPAGLTFYWRMMMPETARYTVLVEKNEAKAMKNMKRVLDVTLSPIPENSPELSSHSSNYQLFSKEFLRGHGRDLFSCSCTWLLLDIIFYSTNLVQSKIYHPYKPNETGSVYRKAYYLAKFQAIMAVCSTIPGYWATVYFIDRVGRVKIQMMGFFCMTLTLLSIGIPYYWYWHHHTGKGFLIIYGLTFFFANFGPNTTTFIVPAELFPARFRSTCHGISAASGKIGAIIGTMAVFWASDRNHDSHGSLRMAVCLVILGVVSLVGMMVTYVFMRETNGRSLEENEGDNGNGHVMSISWFRSCSNTEGQVVDDIERD